MSGKVRREALSRARERRLELDVDRAERERRIDNATADVLVLLQQRDERLQAVVDVEVEVGGGLRRLVQDGLGVHDVAFCCDLTPAEARRLLQHAPAAPAAAPGPPPGSTGPSPQPQAGAGHDGRTDAGSATARPA